MPRRIAAALRRQAAAAQPAECCGALIGVLRRDGAELKALIPLPNDSPDRYEIDAAAVLRLERQAESAGLAVVGFYHSHPAAPATPSATDLELAFPGYIYVIVGGASGCVRGWRLRDDRAAFTELPLDTPLAGAA
jgi:desampylase